MKFIDKSAKAGLGRRNRKDERRQSLTRAEVISNDFHSHVNCSWGIRNCSNSNWIRDVLGVKIAMYLVMIASG